MSNETSQETWNATHAQLLKSVADAQAKLLAGINELAETITFINGFLRGWQTRVDAQHKALADRLDRGIADKLDAIGVILAELAKPRQMERLRTKPIVKAPRKQRR